MAFGHVRMFVEMRTSFNTKPKAVLAGVVMNEQLDPGL